MTSEPSTDELDDATLGALHARIASLEETARWGRWTYRSSPPRLGKLVALVAGAALAAAALTMAVAPTLMDERTPLVIAPYTEPIVLPYDGPVAVIADAAPSLLDVDGDGREEVFVRAYRRGVSGDALYVVALDGKTLATRWRAGPFDGRRASVGPLLALDQRLVVASSLGLYALDASSGYLLGVGNAEAEVSRMMEGAPSTLVVQYAPAPGPPRFAAIAVPVGESVNAWKVLTESEVVARCRPAGNVVCGVRHNALLPHRDAIEAVCPVDGSRTCATRRFEPHPAIAQLFPDGPAYEELDDGQHAVAIVTASFPVGEKAHAFRWNERGSDAAWHAEIAPGAVGRGAPAVASGRLYFAYVTPSRSIRLVARALTNGAVLYDVPVDGLEGGGDIVELTARGGAVFLAANDAIFAIDGETGALRRRLDSL